MSGMFDGSLITKMGKLFYLMGKSASGKDRIYHHLLEQEDLGLVPLVLYTTRPIRKGEKNGREYFFTDEGKLAQLKQEEKLIEERCYNTVYGPWYYFTADEGRVSPKTQFVLGMGTPESYVRLRDYYGAETVCPILIETEDGLRLQRALQRERSQEHPRYQEMCRRFLADCEDFSEEKLAAAGITRRFSNNGTPEECYEQLVAFLRQQIAEA